MLLGISKYRKLDLKEGEEEKEEEKGRRRRRRGGGGGGWRGEEEGLTQVYLTFNYIILTLDPASYISECLTSVSGSMLQVSHLAQHY